VTGPTRSDRTDLRRDRYRGTLVGVVVGDALGARFEGWPGLVPDSAVDEHLQGYSRLDHADDSVLTLAAAESVLYRRRVDADHMAACFVTAYERDPGRGFGPGAAALFAAMARGGDWNELAPAQFGGAGSFGNGAAMRVAPVSLYAGDDPERAADLARRIARITHTHPVGVEGAAVMAAAVSFTIGGHDPVSLPHALQVVCEDEDLSERLWAVAALPSDAGPDQVAALTGTGVGADEAVPAAIAAFSLNAERFTAAIRFAIRLGGDTDTIASMTGALAGAWRGQRAIPTVWRDRVAVATRAAELADRLAILAANGTR
jgi:poly(ADP-ribose) glycohydrolase ARH3